MKELKTMAKDEEELWELMEALFGDCNLKIIDCGEYDDSPEWKVPKSRIVSLKWVRNKLKD